MTYFTYNGRSSADFGLHIEKKDVFSAPEYDAEFISISGRTRAVEKFTKIWYYVLKLERQIGFEEVQEKSRMLPFLLL